MSLYDIIITIVLSIVILLLVFLMVGGILYTKIGIFRFFFHDILAWHMPDGTYHFRGINTHSKCKYCGKDIIQDSQGNWF